MQKVVLLFFFISLMSCKKEVQKKPFLDPIEKEEVVDQSKAHPTDLIRIHNPAAGEEINSPLTISGEARGNWFFEASASVELIDAKENFLAEGIMQAQKNWMTKDFVPFEAKITFENPAAANGYLVFKKANPSGLPENDKEYRLPVSF